MSEAFALSSQTQALLALCVVGVMFLLFLRDSYPTEVVALTGVAALLLLGILPYDTALAVFSNPAPWTIAAMFIVMGALVRTGAIEALMGFATRNAASAPKTTIAAIAIFVVFASAIVSNTPIVVVMIPIVVQLSRTLNLSASKLLIPLSYVAIMGGTLTLIGTSTNLLVDGVAREAGLEPFTIFEVTPVGLVVVAWGLLYLRIVGPYLLPDRISMASLLSDRSKMRFFTEVAIPRDSDLIGQDVAKIALFKREGVRLIDVVRGDASLRQKLQGLALRGVDRVVLRTEMAELLSLQQDKALRPVDQLSAVQTETVEVLITPGCTIIGRKLSDLRLRRRYGIYVLAVHRRNQNLDSHLDQITIRVGDTLLLEGAPEDIQRLATDAQIIDVSKPSSRAYRRAKAPLAIGALIAVVALAGLGIAPIFVLSVIAVAFVLLTGCIDADEAFGFIEGRLLALIFSMLAVGAALHGSGAIALIVEALAPHLSQLSPFLIVWAIYLLTSLLTELVSNNAVAVVVTPVAIAIAQALGIEPRGLVVAVMIAASASFATPIGYQTNTLVYGPGGYKFSDFMKVGIPLNLSIGLIASAVIPLIWPL